MSINVLIVEDEVIVAWDLKERLELIGYKVINTVRSGEEALEIMKKSRIDLIFMDIRLQGSIDGIDTAKQIKNNFKIPILYISANSDLITINEIKQTQPYQYLKKPFNDDQLQKAVNNCKLMINLNKI